MKTFLRPWLRAGFGTTKSLIKSQCDKPILQYQNRFTTEENSYDFLDGVLKRKSRLDKHKSGNRGSDQHT